MKKECPQDVLDSIAVATYGKPANPDLEVNQNLDFQFGFLTGVETASNTDCFGIIGQEFSARKLEFIDDAFKEWKRGFWAGRMKTRLQMK